MEPFALLSAGLISLSDGQFDKQLHLGAGLIVTQAAARMDLPPLQTCLASIGAGLAKEAWDSRGHGNVEFADFAATAFGCQFTFRF